MVRFLKNADKKMPKTMIKQLTPLLMIILSMIACKSNVQDDAIYFAKQLDPYPGTVLLGELRTGFPNDRPGGGVTYQVDAEPDAVFEHYSITAEQSGWTIVESVPRSENDPLSYQRYKQDDWTMRIIVRPVDDQVQITILVYQ
jgi:hypothetical protein